MKIYLVGGAVRDQLLNRPIKERDWVVVGATPEQMLALGYRLIGKDFPVFLHPETHEEYALARTERKTGRGYKGFVVYAEPTVTLEEDLRRRDLTINAIAMTEAGELVDPFGGKQDLLAGRLRHVSDSFIEDPVRILRVARFMARYKHLGFSVAPETMKLMQHMVAIGEADHLVPERVWQELHDALTEQHPSAFIDTLRESHAFAVVFPELDKLFGVPNPPKWHPEIDSGIHTCMVVDMAAHMTLDPQIRYAALMHDVGKALTPPEKWPSHRGHDEAGVAVIKAFGQRVRVPNDYTELATLVSRFHGTCHSILEADALSILTLLEKTDAFRRPERFEAFLLTCLADFRGRTGYEDKPYPQADLLRQALTAAKAIPVPPLLDEGFTGAVLANRLHELRVEAIQQLLAN